MNDTQNTAPETAEIVLKAINTFDNTPGLGQVGRQPRKIAVKDIPNILNIFPFAAPSSQRKLTPAELHAKTQELKMEIPEMILFVQDPKNQFETVSAGIKTLKQWKAEAPDTEIFVTKTQLKNAMAQLVNDVWDAMAPEEASEATA